MRPKATRDPEGPEAYPSRLRERAPLTVTTVRDPDQTGDPGATALGQKAGMAVHVPLYRPAHIRVYADIFDSWLFNDSPRYCPRCLAGDGSTVQQKYGGPWKKVWQLPIAFLCPDHRAYLHHGCPRKHETSRVTPSSRAPSMSACTLPNAACRNLESSTSRGSPTRPAESASTDVPTPGLDRAL